MSYIIDNSDSKVLFIDSPLLERLLIVRNDLKKLSTVVVRGPLDQGIAGSFPFQIVPFDELFKGSPDPLKVNISKKDPAGILYTSGTTGFSKGVVLCHNSLLGVPRLLAKYRQLGPEDVPTFLPTLPWERTGAKCFVRPCRRCADCFVGPF